MPNIIGVWEEQYDEYGEYQPFVYDNGAWSSQIDPYVWYEGEWQPIGRAGTLMIPFMTSDGEYFYTSDGKMFLVRNHAKNIYSVVQCQLTTSPTKTRYMVGETFDPTGMVIQVQYQNRGQQITRQVTHYTYSTDPLTVGTTSVTIHCTLADQNYTDITVPITVYEPIISIAVTTPPTHTSYYITETFDPTGMIVTATINLDGDIESRVITNYTYPNTPLAVTDTSVQFQWTYMPGYTTSTTQAITVSLPTVTLALVQPPTKTLYDRGDSFDPTGMVISATISGTYGNTTNIITDYFYNNAPLGSTSQSITMTYIYEGQVTATLDVPITVMIPQVSIEITQIPNKNVYNLGDFFDPAGMIIEATVVTATGSETYEISNYTWGPTDELSTNDTSIQFSWTYEDQTAEATLPIAVRTQQVETREFDGTETVGADPVTGDPWIPWPTISLATADTFTIGVKLYQDTANANDATVFSNIRVGQNDYGIRLGLKNGNYVLTWGNDNTLAYMPNTAKGAIAIMIEHEANSSDLLVTYYNLNSNDDISYVNATSGLTDNEFVMAIGAGLDSNGDLNTTTGSNDKWHGVLIDFSVFNNTMPTRGDVEKYLGLDIDMNSCVVFESPNTFTLAISEPNQYWDGTLEYSTDSLLWVAWDGTTTITAQLLHGKYTILMRGINNTTLTGTYSEGTFGEQDFTFKLSPNLAATNVFLKGDISALINYQNKPTAIPDDFCFGGLFAGQSAITYAHQLSLPFTTLTESCYEGMFYGCSNLISAPALPATTMVDYCYSSMFGGCESLTAPPALPATTLAPSCYEWMFEGCVSLTTAPTLPATTLETYCYSSMFDGCSSLTVAPILAATTLADNCYFGMFARTGLINAPSLPATSLADGCYYSMFMQCTSLTTTPVLSATTMMPNCYNSMFYGCTSLTSAPSLPATTLASHCYDSMFYSCTSLVTPPTLPATILTNSNYCYNSMFEGCSSLVTPPQLPATTLANNCYTKMFYNCISLTTAPQLPATTLTNYCYDNMFRGCTSLTIPPSLSATTLATSCYRALFYGCTSLVTAPALIATTLSNGCYTNMFYNCSSLTVAPELPALTLTSSCYSGMFRGCTSLLAAPALPATTLNGSCYDSMFYGCTSLTSLPELAATTLPNYCYQYMFMNCTNIKLSETQTDEYVLPYRIPSSGTGTAATGPLTLMFSGTGGTFTGTPIINTTYYMPINDYITFSSQNSFSVYNYYRAKGWDGTLEYSNDNGNTWTTWTGDSASAGLVNGKYQLKFRGIGNTYLNNANNTSYYYSWRTSGTNVKVTGNIARLLDYTYSDTLPTMADYAFFYWLGGGYTNITNLEELVLPFTTLTKSCYANMFSGVPITKAPALPALNLAESCYYNLFYGCSRLVDPPILPATTLAKNCYERMFEECPSLTATPALNATTMVEGCYKQMFGGCDALTTAPALPAMSLATKCYYDMFWGCDALINPPTLSATALASQCYWGMFQDCSSLTAPPALNATQLAGGCYEYMFKGCSSLQTMPALPATTITSSCYSSMFSGCTSLTTAPSVLPATTLYSNCYNGMFSGCTSLRNAPTLPATVGAEYSVYGYMFKDCASLTTPPKINLMTLRGSDCKNMFENCTSLTSLPALPATAVGTFQTYNSMFKGCTGIKLSTSQTGEYQTAYRIPKTGTGTGGTGSALTDMFADTGGTFTGTPTINTTYYLSNTNSIVS